MDAARMLREARRNAGLTQRRLAERTRIPQPAIARIESGAAVPRADTLERLLAGCGRELVSAPRPGAGVDRGPIRALLAVTPSERLRLATREARNLERLLRSAAR
jgi:transcriptional regulator with XRE-family HTH domain